MRGRGFILCIILLLFSISLFGGETFDCQQTIYTFLERYAQELRKGKVDNVNPEQKMKSDKVLTLNGNFRLLPSSWSQLDLSAVYYENRGYEVVWSSKGDTLWHIAFLNSYELILGKSRNELEIQLKDDIMKSSSEYTFSYDSLSISHVVDSIYCSKNYLTYESKALSTKSYFIYSTDGRYTLLRDVSYPELLVTNICQFPLFPDMQLKVTQNIYGNRTRDYVLPLKQWLSYCQQQEIIVYTCIESNVSGVLKVLVICENKPMGYNHMLSFEFLIEDGELVTSVPIPTLLTAYIPTYNVIKD